MPGGRPLTDTRGVNLTVGRSRTAQHNAAERAQRRRTEPSPEMKCSHRGGRRWTAWFSRSSRSTSPWDAKLRRTSTKAWRRTKRGKKTRKSDPAVLAKDARFGQQCAPLLDSTTLVRRVVLLLFSLKTFKKYISQNLCSNSTRQCYATNTDRHRHVWFIGFHLKYQKLQTCHLLTD